MALDKSRGTTATTSKLNLHQLPDDKPVYACQKCSEVVALQDELVSKAFNGQSGRAFLMNSTINTRVGKQEERNLMFVYLLTSFMGLWMLIYRTGQHVVANLYCVSCDTILGWMYISTPNGHEKYKEGRYIIEEAKVVKENNW